MQAVDGGAVQLLQPAMDEVAGVAHTLVDVQSDGRPGVAQPLLDVLHDLLSDKGENAQNVGEHNCTWGGGRGWRRGGGKGYRLASGGETGGLAGSDYEALKR